MSLKAVKEALCSAIAITVCPFTEAGGLDLEAYGRVTARMVDEGVTIITPNGNTGEFYALSPDECRAVLSESIRAAAGRATIVPGVGYDEATAIDMARFAQRAGAPAVMLHQFIHPYRSAEGWIDYHRNIARAVPETGIVLYVRDQFMTAAMLSRLLDLCPNVIGIKYGVPDPAAFSRLVNEVGLERLAWICGVAEGQAPFFWLGGSHGFTSGVVNVVPGMSLEMLSCLRAGDYPGAMRVWRQLKPFEDLRARRGGANSVSPIKEALSQLGLCGRTVRPPISSLPPSEREEVAAILSQWAVRMPAAER